ncbi:unannotated protein [freshwater metagenome]|uniref:Unannotated protein n=1 Tax=freshwater metagenome TaxID=449393 RepID=A0A6J6FM32_9ZZZZ
MEQYRVNDAGDVCARLSGIEWEPFEPEQFGWASPGGRTTPDERRALDQLMALPSFEVVVAEGPRFVPGPRPARPVPWGSWKDGAAPPAAAESKGGVDGTLAYSDRLTDALGLVAQRLPVKPERSPFIVHDFVGGRRFEVSFRPPPLGPGGEGQVYVLDDGFAYKIGHTTGHVAARIAGLQTGNPRTIRAVATISPATDAVESHLHAAFGSWYLQGEWFRRGEIRAEVESAGGWEGFLLTHLPSGAWTITLYPGHS